ncbi:hypothetical protein Y032_0087g2096 [Ancylostoma ceylanicum]|nr:hypothetical protein Y032_0087g2096 [Ancylostoma ceylanicum]
MERGRRSGRTPRRNRAAPVCSLDPGSPFKFNGMNDSGRHPLHFFGSYDIHLSHLSSENLSIFPSAARRFEDCSRDARMNRPITALQRTSCHAAMERLLH